MTTIRASSLQRLIDDPDTGSIKRRALRRKLAAVITVGPTELHPEPPTPDGATRIKRHRAQTVAPREHADTIKNELRAIDAHAAWIEERLAWLDSRPRVAVGPGVASSSYEFQELRSEVGQLGTLRAELAADAERPPIADERTRAIVRARSKALAEQAWWSAERAAREGDHRRARMLRHDALRSRHVAEREMGIRTSLRGYSHV